MADPIIGAFDWAWKTLFAACASLIGWITMRQVKRIDALEANSVTRREYDGTIERLSREIRESSDRQEQMLARYTQTADERGKGIHDRIDKLTAILIEQARRHP